MEIPDETLVARYQRDRCVDSLDSLLCRYSEWLPKLLCQIGVDETVCRDLTQDVLVRAFRSITQFEGRSSFRTWVTRVAINRAKDHFREIRRSKEKTNVELGVAIDPTDADSERRIHEHSELEERMERLEKAMDSLSEPLRLALVLTTVHGMSAADAAQVLGCTRNALYFRIHKAKKILKHQLQG
ncbi:MAG: RNA polymerase sigma factor [Aureliella sp.]